MIRIAGPFRAWTGLDAVLAGHPQGIVQLVLCEGDFIRVPASHGGLQRHPGLPHPLPHGREELPAHLIPNPVRRVQRARTEFMM
ncbi:hypothetical protein [Streptomyces odonnellii]|uniref:hypothetical protein n=1 Tax=Streptomyces odonnellii TaxID=1417980 RepID=UPI0006265134|nr:hypothetical protein [Streptomyces odonnellii]